MSIKKQFVKNNLECKVTFKFESKGSTKPNSVKLVGDFNSWDIDAEPMKSLKSGVFTQTINLAADSKYQFRYLVDNKEWFNDDLADDYVDAGLGNDEQNSVVQL